MSALICKSANQSKLLKRYFKGIKTHTSHLFKTEGTEFITTQGFVTLKILAIQMSHRMVANGEQAL